MHPKAALLALQGFVPLHWDVPQHSLEYTFFAVHCNLLGSKGEVPTLTVNTFRQLTVLDVDLSDFVPGNWDDVPDKLWDALSDNTVAILREESHAS